MARSGTIAAIVAVALAAGACGGSAPQKEEEKEVETGAFDVRRLLGVESTAPDEFAVISKRPLEMPTDFAALPAPTPGAHSSRTPDAISEARQTLLREQGGANAATTRTSVSEAALLSAAGASDPNIRTTLETEYAEYQDEENSYFLDDVIPGLREYRGADSKDTIKPFDEYKRLNPQVEGGAAPAPRGTEIATIPGSPRPTAPQTTVPAPSPAPAAPAQTSSSTPFPAIGGAPSSDGELIYIPE